MNAKMLTTKEVAKEAGVAVNSIRSYRVRGTMPEPDQYIGTTPVWKISTIKQWLRERPPVGRPRKDQE